MVVEQGHVPEDVVAEAQAQEAQEEEAKLELEEGEAEVEEVEKTGSVTFEEVDGGPDDGLTKEVETGQVGGNVPEWLESFIAQSSEEQINALGDDESQTINQLNQQFGADLKELPYEYLMMLFPLGSESEEVAKLLREKRSQYLVDHPEEFKGNPDATEGMLSCDGQFMPMDKWRRLSPGEKFAWIVGRTCFHYNGDVSGYGDDAEYRRRSESEDLSA